MTRKQALTVARIAGYHGDSHAFTRALVEARVSRSSMTAAWRQGEAARRQGVGCECVQCGGTR